MSYGETAERFVIAGAGALEPAFEAYAAELAAAKGGYPD